MNLKLNRKLFYWFAFNYLLNATNQIQTNEIIKNHYFEWYKPVLYWTKCGKSAKMFNDDITFGIVKPWYNITYSSSDAYLKPNSSALILEHRDIRLVSLYTFVYEWKSLYNDVWLR